MSFLEKGVKVLRAFSYCDSPNVHPSFLILLRPYYSDILENEYALSICFKNTVVQFNVHGSVHRKNIPTYIKKDATLHSFTLSGGCSTCFWWYPHPSSGTHATVSTASGIGHTVTATCRYREGVGMMGGGTTRNM